MNKSKILTSDELCNNNIKFVYYLVNNFLKKNNHLIYLKDDLIGSAFLGLVKASKKYDYSKEYKFTTFSSICIMNEIYIYLRKINKTFKCVSLYEKISEDKNGNELLIIDTIKSKENLEKQTELNEINCEIFKFINYLNKKERDIFNMRFNLHLKQWQIGEKLNLSQSIISRKIKVIKLKIQRHLEFLGFELNI